MDLRPKTVAELEDLLSEPQPETIASLQKVEGDILILGANGKIGPSLARMARRAALASAAPRKIYAVARFRSEEDHQNLRKHGIETITCDLLDSSALNGLPDVPNVIFLAGRKFGSTGQTAMTWAINTHLPGTVCEKYRKSRIVALSTGNIYGLTPVTGPGSREEDEPRPVGEYAASCLGRERIFEYFSEKNGTPVSIIRLFYACDLRYGVLVDLAERVQREELIHLDMGHFNIIWQGDSNNQILRALGDAASPPSVLNITGPEMLSIRKTAEKLGALLGKSPRFAGAEKETGVLGNTARAQARFGTPTISSEKLIEAVAHWICNGGRTLGKPTGFEVRDGRY